MGTWYVLDVVDGELVRFCDECVDGVGEGNNNDRVGCYDGSCDGTDKCCADGAVVDLVEGSNFGYVEGYIRWGSGGWDGGDDDGCIYGLTDVVDVGDGAGDVVGQVIVKFWGT